MTNPPGFEFVAGHVALEFVNTVDWRLDEARRHELLGRFDDLVTWAKLAGVVDAQEARELNAAAERDRAAAARSLRRALRVREVLFRILRAGGRDDRPAARDERLFNAFLVSALRKRRLESRGASWKWSWARGPRDTFDSILWSVVLAAAELLTSPARVQIGECAGEGCGWLFLDTSRTARRRWCTMRGCGNRAKVRRFYQRSRAIG